MKRILILTVAVAFLGCGTESRQPQETSQAVQQRKPDLARADKLLPPVEQRATYKGLTAYEWGRRLFDRDENMWFDAVRVIGALDDDGIPYLIEAAWSDNELLRHWALIELRNVRSAKYEKGVAEACIATVNDPRFSNRVIAGMSICELAATILKEQAERLK